jgi:hypothetical protein
VYDTAGMGGGDTGDIPRPGALILDLSSNSDTYYTRLKGVWGPGAEFDYIEGRVACSEGRASI